MCSCTYGLFRFGSCHAQQSCSNAYLMKRPLRLERAFDLCEVGRLKASDRWRRYLVFDTMTMPAPATLTRFVVQIPSQRRRDKRPQRLGAFFLQRVKLDRRALHLKIE